MSAATSPLVSIVIVSWNGLELLKACLPSVVATRYPNLEIILADNGSADGSAEWVARTFPEVKIVRHPENWAFSRGNNEAIAHTAGKYIVLLNNDMEVPPDWLDPLVETMERDASIGAVQPKLLQHTDHSMFEYAGACGGFLDRLGYPFARGRIFFTVEEDRGQYDDEADVFWATGAAIMLRRAALDEVGLLDEHFRLHMEEIDLCWRLQRHGYRVVVNPKSETYHIGGASLPQGTPLKAYYNFRNSLLLLFKNLPPATFRRILVQRVLFDGAAWWRALFTGRPREALAITRAYLDGHRMRRLYAGERPSPEEPAVLPPYRRSIVVDYFLRRIRSFANLPTDWFLPLREQVRRARQLLLSEHAAD